LRPTSDRARETLFNWLTPILGGARVLDMFAGTGVLGLEAVSRGAASATLVEKNPAAAKQLATVAARLTDSQVSARIEVIEADILALDSFSDASFELIFIDPPFSADLYDASLVRAQELLTPAGRVILETPQAMDLPIPADWVLSKSGVFGEVRIQLLQRRVHPL